MESKRFEGDSEFLLPPEIVTEILSRLPADSAIGCRGICKQWRSLIDHPSFRDTHTRQLISSSSTSNPKQFGNSSSSSFGFFLCALQEDRVFHLQFVNYIDHGEELVPEFKPCKPITDKPFPFYNNWGTLTMSTCNGLVFMVSSSNTNPNYVNDMFVCNPFTREYVNLCTVHTTTTTTTTDENDAEEHQRRQLERKKFMAYGFGYLPLERKRFGYLPLERKGFMTYGFGYLPSTNEYKIVSIYYPSQFRKKGYVSIYTLGSGRWRNKGEIPYRMPNLVRKGFFANGAIHWIRNMEIVTFDLANEKFNVVVPLPPIALSGPCFDELGVLAGCLCVTRSYTRTNDDNDDLIKDIWVLNVNNKAAEEFSWNKRFSIPWNGTTYRVEPHVILKSGKILLRSGYGLISYDPKTGAFNEDNQSIFYDPRLEGIPYTKSFVSLKTLGEENAKCFRDGFVSDALAQPSQQHQRVFYNFGFA